MCEVRSLTHDAHDDFAGRNHPCAFAREDAETQLTPLPKPHDSVHLDLCLEAQLDSRGSAAGQLPVPRHQRLVSRGSTEGS